MATPLDFPIPSAGDSLLADSYVSSHKAASKASPAVGSVHDLAISPPRDRPALSFPELAVRLIRIHFTPARTNTQLQQPVGENKHDTPVHLEAQPDFGFYDEEDD